MPIIGAEVLMAAVEVSMAAEVVFWVMGMGISMVVAVVLMAAA